MAAGVPSARLDAILADYTDAYLQLHTGDPGAAGTANTTSAVADRKQVSFGSAGTNSGTRRRRNDAIVRWDAEDVTGSASITHGSLWDAETDGNFLHSGTLTVTATSGVPIEVPVDGFEVNVGPLAS